MGETDETTPTTHDPTTDVSAPSGDATPQDATSSVAGTSLENSVTEHSDGTVLGAEGVAATNAEGETAQPATTQLPTEQEPTSTTEENGDDTSSSRRGSLGASFAKDHESRYLRDLARKKADLKTQLLDKSKIPTSYYVNSKHEKMVLEYADNFHRQYTQLYPGRKEVLLSPTNEFGVRKFICTTIRPTQVPYKDLYDHRSCAKFVADHLHYETLDPPHEVPQSVPSPSYTLKMQSGNSFDFAVLLTSLLRGVGYDAYVVSGYATREITLMDQSATRLEKVGFPAPMDVKADMYDVLKEVENEKRQLEESKRAAKSHIYNSNKYRFKNGKTLKSQFLLRQEQKIKEIQELQEQERKAKEARERELEDFVEDELKGLRVHAWVLVLPGKREIGEAFFIEPTTGDIYDIDNENYLGIESIFNHQNIWVNMQTCFNGLKGISFDLADNVKWEFVLLGNTHPKLSQARGNNNKLESSSKTATTRSKPEEEEEEEEEYINPNGQRGQVLDLPPSWVGKLNIPIEQYESRCPMGSKILTFKNGRVELFADYNRHDGMIMRIVYFSDASQDFHGQVREFYSNRKDRLKERVRIPYQDEIHEFFEPGRYHGLKKHVIIAGNTREMHFYPHTRADGLVKRVELPTKVMDFFIDRDDKLTYRSVTYDVNNAIDEDTGKEVRVILKMAEKFERTPEKSPFDDPAKKTFFLREEKIRVMNHVDNGSIIPTWREFRKPPADNKGTGFLDFTTSFEVNPCARQAKKQEIFGQILSHLKAEQNCISAIKASEREMKEILNLRGVEEKEIGLQVSIYDTVHNQEESTSEEEKDNKAKGDSEESKSTELDYLSPFLVNYTTAPALSREEALNVKDTCLKALKERLIEKANIIQTRLDELTSEYQKRQMAYSRNADTMSAEETEEYVKFCNDALFKIHILEKRLSKHKESAPQKYMEMDVKLRADPRLVVLQQ